MIMKSLRTILLLLKHEERRLTQKELVVNENDDFCVFGTFYAVKNEATPLTKIERCNKQLKTEEKHMRKVIYQQIT